MHYIMPLILHYVALHLYTFDTLYEHFCTSPESLDPGEIFCVCQWHWQPLLDLTFAFFYESV